LQEKYRDVLVEQLAEKVVYKDFPVEKLVEQVVHRDIPVEIPVNKLVEKTVYRHVPVEARWSRVDANAGAFRIVGQTAMVNVKVGRGVGIGLNLARRDSGSTTFVESIVPGFAAENSGRFMVGDLVETIDGVSVREFTLDGLKELTIAAEGTTVVVGALRDGRAFTVTLTRIFPELKNVTNEGIRQLLR
jgi:C-terminal processing protease CtpA/Prc